MEHEQSDNAFIITRGTDKPVKNDQEPVDHSKSPPKRKGTLPYKVIWGLIKILLIISVLGIIYYLFTLFR